MNPGRLVVLLLVVVFSLATGLAFAAGDGWVVIKDKKGVCKVIKAKEKTPATIAGPFKTQEEADKAKDKECPKAGESVIDKMKGKAKQEIEGAKSSLEKMKDKVKDKIKQSVPSDKKN